MKSIYILLAILLLAGCAAEKKIYTEVPIPEIDRSTYNDSSFEAGWESLKAGNPKEAIKYFQMSQAADEKLFVGFGYAFLAQNNFQLAKKNFEKSLALNSENIQAEFGMATLYELMKDMDHAFQIYAKLRVKYPENAWVKIRYDFIKSTETQKYLEQAQQYKTANNKTEYIKALDKASTFSPEIIEIKVEIADFYREEEDYKNAIYHYEKILETLPNKESILLKLAEVYEKTEKLDSAIIIYKKLLEFKPGEKIFIEKINQLRVKFFDLKIPEKFQNPQKFKNIFFKENINREELAALIGYYFDDYLEEKSPVIITDITGSFAKTFIIRVCTLGIMDVRPDHSFNRYKIINRTDFSRVIHSLLQYLQQNRKIVINFLPLDEVVEPADISPLHKDYKIIKFLVNSQLIKLDIDNHFNPLAEVTPADALVCIKTILNSIEDNNSL